MTADPKKVLELPILPLRDVVIYPHMVIPLFVGRAKSVKALEAAMLEDKKVFLVAQRQSANDDPTAKDLFKNAAQSTRSPESRLKKFI